MKRTSLQEMTVDQLVERFVAIGMDQDKALRTSAIAKFNLLFDEMRAIERELKSRNGDQRRAVASLPSSQRTRSAKRCEGDTGCSA